MFDRLLVLIAFATLSFWMQAGLAMAQDSSAALRVAPDYEPADPLADAADLASLAPPSRISTQRYTFGDARVRHVHSTARRGAQRQLDCLFDFQGTHLEGCVRLQRKSAHEVSPAYVSAPTVFYGSVGEPSPLRSPLVEFLLGTSAR